MTHHQERPNEPVLRGHYYRRHAIGLRRQTRAPRPVRLLSRLRDAILPWGICVGSLAVALLPATGRAVTPPNDECANATVIDSVPYTNSVNIGAATSTDPNATDICSWGSSDGPRSVWYSFTPQESMWTTVRATGPHGNMVVREGCPAGSTFTGCYREGVSACNMVKFLAVAGKSYIIGVSGDTYPSSSDTITFELFGCGDGVVRSTGTSCTKEACDDGNTENGDGCSNECKVETCWSCTGSPSDCAALTGTTCPDDGNVCTSDVCSVGTCTHPNLEDGTSCPNSNPCTTAAECRSGSCERVDEICLSGFCGTTGPCVVSTQKNLAPESILDLGGRDLHVTDSGIIEGHFGFENAGSVTIDPKAILRSPGGGYQTISIDSLGPCTVHGSIQSNGTRAFQSSGDGGTIRLDCSAIDIGPTGVLEAYGEGVSYGGGNDWGFAGKIYLDARSGGITVAPGAKMRATGQGYKGGTVAVTASNDCEIAGQIRADSTSMPVPGDSPDGGDGGSVSVACDNVHLAPTAKVISGSDAEARAGLLDIDAAGDVRVDKGSLLTNAGSGSDAGRSLTISAGGSCTLANAMKAAGRNPMIEMDCGDLRLTRDFKIKGSGAEAAEFRATAQGSCLVEGDIAYKGATYKDGGQVTIDCYGDLTQTQDSSIDVSCSADAPAGRIRLLTDGALRAGGKLASNAKYAGFFTGPGRIELRGHGVTVAETSKLKARGKSGSRVEIRSQNPAGQIAGDVALEGRIEGAGLAVNIEGCNVRLAEKAKISTKAASAGVNTLIAHEALTIDGSVLSVSGEPTATPGSNVLKYRTAASVLDPEKIVPATIPEPDSSLSACP